MAVAGKELSPEERRKYCQLVKPATILAWFRQLGARKYDSSEARKLGRPRKVGEIRKLVIEIAQGNQGWGYTKIRDALRTGLKMEIGRTRADLASFSMACAWTPGRHVPATLLALSEGLVRVPEPRYSSVGNLASVGK